MTRNELEATLNLKIELIRKGKKNRPGTIISPNKITIHNTSNPNQGADANAHSRFVRTTGHYVKKDGTKSWVSWHFTVDDRIVIRQLPLTEAGNHSKVKGNASSLAIEVCMQKGIDQKAADERAVKLAAILCYDLSLSVDDVVTHKYWTGKNCPILLLQKWDDFKDRIAYYLNLISSTPKSFVKTRSMKTTPAEVEMVGSMCWEGE